jgi:hypothetical protein
MCVWRDFAVDLQSAITRLGLNRQSEFLVAASQSIMSLECFAIVRVSGSDFFFPGATTEVGDVGLHPRLIIAQPVGFYRNKARYTAKGMALSDVTFWR